MTKQQIIAYREKAKKYNAQLFIFLDNELQFYDGQRDAEVLIWDDDEELCTILGPIRQTVYMANTPYELYSFSYDEIQGMGLYLDSNDMISELKAFKDRGVITEEEFIKKLKELAPIGRINTAPFERTMRTYDEKDYKNYVDEKKGN